MLSFTWSELTVFFTDTVLKGQDGRPEPINQGHFEKGRCWNIFLDYFEQQAIFRLIGGDSEDSWWN